MMHKHNQIREKHILGAATTHSLVKSSAYDPRSWLADAPLCSDLRRHKIAHCGIMHAAKPMEIVRLKPSGSFFLACFGGAGEILVDGIWRQIQVGTGCLQPAFMVNAMRAKSRAKWDFCWVRYQDLTTTDPIASLHSPTLNEFDSTALVHAMHGIISEAKHAESTLPLRHWVDLIHSYVSTFAQPFRRLDRLQKLWQLVEADLGSDWTLHRLAQEAGLSKEHLRRLSAQSIGRSPIQHVMHLRMHHAAHLLATTRLDMTQIASRIAFSNPFSFSNTFLRWTGSRPSVYRNQYQTDG